MIGRRRKKISKKEKEKKKKKNQTVMLCPKPMDKCCRFFYYECHGNAWSMKKGVHFCSVVCVDTLILQ